jgi:hypothetical protein
VLVTVDTDTETLVTVLTAVEIDTAVETDTAVLVIVL